MSEKLLFCPFCGGEASVQRCEHAFHDAKIRCAGCQAEGPIFDVNDGEANEAGRNEAEAIAAWNRRTPAPEGVVQTDPPVVPAPEGEAWPADDPRYEIDVTYEVWQGDSMVAGSSDLAEAQRYAALYEPCSLLRATTYRQPAHLPYASPVVPVGSGQADKMAHVLRGMVKRGTLIDAEAIDRALKLATYKQDPDDDDRAWAASQAEVIGQPVVPVGSGEPVARATCQDCGSHIEGWICQSCDREFRENDAGNFVFEGQPVVPVGVSREEIIKAVRPVLDRHPMIDSSQSHKLDIQAGWVADAVLAALRPTDTGRQA